MAKAKEVKISKPKATSKQTGSKAAKPKANSKAAVTVKQKPVAKKSPASKKVPKIEQPEVKTNTEPVVSVDKIEESVTLAKAGRRSAKALKEQAELQAKEERKLADKEESQTVKPIVKHNPPRSRLERRGKNYRKLAEQIDKTKVYDIKEAVALVVKSSPVKFDATVELHIRLGVDPKQSDHNIRGTVILPSGSGNKVKVAVLAEGDDAKKALAAGAESASMDELFASLDKEQISFDVLISTPVLMPKLSKYARLLGPKGLMPNPKSGTVASDVAKAVKEATTGRTEYRIDSTGIVHMGVGKISFGPDKLLANLETVLTAIKNSKPSNLKGNYITSIFLTSSMGPSVKVQI